MRDYLFKAKRKDNGEWVEGFYLHHRESLTDKGDHYIVVALGFGFDWYSVDPDTIGQYTGLKDKNGKRIFEGDIVHYLYEPGAGYWNSDQHSVIEWKSTGFFMRGIMGTNKYACSTGWLVSTPHGDGKCFEVIGNIYDNPELAEGVI